MDYLVRFYLNGEFYELGHSEFYLKKYDINIHSNVCYVCELPENNNESTIIKLNDERISYLSVKSNTPIFGENIKKCEKVCKNQLHRIIYHTTSEMVCFNCNKYRDAIRNSTCGLCKKALVLRSPSNIQILISKLKYSVIHNTCLEKQKKDYDSLFQVFPIRIDGMIYDEDRHFDYSCNCPDDIKTIDRQVESDEDY